MKKIPYVNRDKYLDTSGKIVAFYEREYYCFSNFSSFAVKWKGQLWPTSEHAYHGAKFLKTAPALAKKVLHTTSAHAALKLAYLHKNKYRKDWNEVKLAIMEDILRHKVKQHPYVLYKLKQTGNKLMVEDSFRDAYWGWGEKRDGENALGKIWMKIGEDIIRTK